jgi:putative oxidoreductase
MLKALLSPLSDRIYAGIRIVTGLMFSFHGMQKTFGLLWTQPFPRPALGSQVGIGGVLELTTGILIALGLFTRCAAFLASGMMAVAYWQFHVFASPLAGAPKFIPAMNNGSPAVLYCFWFLYMASKGAGPWSVDSARERTPAKA